MSGGGIEYAQMKTADQLIDGHYERELRRAAEFIEDGSYVADSLDETERQQLAALLRNKADVVQAARESVRRAFNAHGMDQLLKSIDYGLAGDYGPDKVEDAWNDYVEGEVNE